MKKLLLLFITLTTLTNVSYSSFPITENNTVLTANLLKTRGDEEATEEPAWYGNSSTYLMLLFLISGSYLLLRTILACMEQKKMVGNETSAISAIIDFVTNITSAHM